MRPAKLVVRLRVNGQPHESLIEPRKLLCDFLRYDLGLTGTHVGCEHGACGACTVVVNGEAVKSCLMLAVQAREADVLTVEGLAGYGQTPSPNPLPPQGAGASDVGLTGRPLAPSPSRGTGASGAGHPGVLPPSPSRGEGGAGGDRGLHPVQRAFHEHHALQCGFCTPGMLLAALTLLEENPHPTDEEIKLGMDGNLCRCTGYYNIIAAIRAAAAGGGEA